MTSSLREQTHRPRVVRVLLLLAIGYQAVVSLVAVIERISRQHWSAALFYIYPMIAWSTCLLIFCRMPDLRQLQAERREALSKGLPSERLGSPTMVAPFAMIIGLAAERFSYNPLHHSEPNQGTRNILLAIAAALTSAAICFVVLVWMAKRGQRMQGESMPGGDVPVDSSGGMGVIRLVREPNGWRSEGSYDVLIDSSKACSLKQGRHQDISVAAGTHALRVAKGWRGSPTTRIVVEEDTTQVWACGPMPPGQPGSPESTAHIKLRQLNQAAITPSSASAEGRSI
jgi:hypothetical protein